MKGRIGIVDEWDDKCPKCKRLGNQFFIAIGIPGMHITPPPEDPDGVWIYSSDDLDINPKIQHLMDAIDCALDEIGYSSSVHFEAYMKKYKGKKVIWQEIGYMPERDKKWNRK